MKAAAKTTLTSSAARKAWKKLAAAFPSWSKYLDSRDGELEFAVPAPRGSKAGHLIAFSNGDDLWLRFAPPCMCYPVDDANEMVSLIERLTADRVVFRVTMKGADWVETTLANAGENCDCASGQTVHQVSWSGRFDQVVSS